MTTLAWPSEVLAVGPSLGALVKGRHAEFFHAGIAVSHVETCAAALVAMTSDSMPRAIVAASRLPDMSLAEFVRVLGLVGIRPVFVDSATVECAVVARTGSAVHLIEFPVTPMRLSASLRTEACAPAATARDEPVAVAGLALDPRALRATWHGRLLRLQVRPFEILRYLVEASPRVVSPQELASEMVPGTGDRGIAAVRVAIGRIRIAMAASGVDAPSPLQTIPGHGYRVAEAGRAMPSSSASEATRPMI